MRVPPLLRSLTRHRLTVSLMVLTIAFTCAIVTNIASMIAHRMALLDAPSGLDESSIVTVDSSQVSAGRPDGDGGSSATRLSEYRADVAALRGIAGVKAVAVAFGLPLYGGFGIDVASNANAPQDQDFQVTGFAGSPGELETLGLHLVEGRDFLPSEYVPSDNFAGLRKATSAVVSRAMAMRLFHTSDAVGRVFYLSHQPMTVVGVVAHLMGMDPQLGAADNEYAMLLPVEPNGTDVTFVLRTTPQDRERVLKQAVSILGTRDPLRIESNATTFSRARAKYFQRDSAMIGLLLACGIAMLIVTAAGIAGLASFWVQQRTHSIGIRRAVGATRADILRYFHTENFLIVTGGVLLGCLFAYALNLVLMRFYALHVLPPVYLAVGAVAMWAMGQIAVLGPAVRASRVPPAVAIRES